MNYVVFHRTSTRLFSKHSRGMRVTSFDTYRSAKIFRTKLLKTRPELAREDVDIAQSDVFYSRIEKQVERKNIMSGELFMEAVNTPNHCSPASEAYWSM